MANIKSAKKRIKVAEKKAERNKAIRSEVKTEIKKVETLAESGDKAAVEAALREATAVIEKAGSKGVLKKNTVARRVSRIARAANKAQA